MSLRNCSLSCGEVRLKAEKRREVELSRDEAIGALPLFRQRPEHAIPPGTRLKDRTEVAIELELQFRGTPWEGSHHMRLRVAHQGWQTN